MSQAPLSEPGKGTDYLQATGIPYYLLTFMPKPVFEDNGSGKHTHWSLRKDGKP